MEPRMRVPLRQMACSDRVRSRPASGTSINRPSRSSCRTVNSLSTAAYSPALTATFTAVFECSSIAGGDIDAPTARCSVSRVPEPPSREASGSVSSS